MILLVLLLFLLLGLLLLIRLLLLWPCLSGLEWGVVVRWLLPIGGLELLRIRLLEVGLLLRCLCGLFSGVMDVDPIALKRRRIRPSVV
uniref:Uncharacterized protein n=1 Tax=Mycolicibacterium mucogenicum DSM 44124 TaxID=1226753 RepID=A0A8H2PHZ5_MYCMU